MKSHSICTTQGKTGSRSERKNTKTERREKGMRCLSARSCITVLSILAIAWLGTGCEEEVIDSVEVSPDVPMPEEPSMVCYYTDATVLQLKAIARMSDDSTKDVTDLADWSSSDPSVGVVNASGVFYAATPGPGRTEIIATYEGVSSDPVLIHMQTIHKDLGQGSEPGMKASPAVLAPRGTATPDEDAAEAAKDLLKELEKAGVGVDELRDALDDNEFHQEGKQAGGVKVGKDAGAVTFFPGITFYNGWVVIVWDGNTHVVLKESTMNDLKEKNFFINSSINDSADTIIHELLHVKIYREDIDAGDDDEEEDLVTELATAINYKVGISRANTAERRERYQSNLDAYVKTIKEKEGGPELLEQLNLG
jgi:hypothetical protein